MNASHLVPVRIDIEKLCTMLSSLAPFAVLAFAVLSAGFNSLKADSERPARLSRPCTLPLRFLNYEPRCVEFYSVACQPTAQLRSELRVADEVALVSPDAVPARLESQRKEYFLRNRLILTASETQPFSLQRAGD